MCLDARDRHSTCPGQRLYTGLRNGQVNVFQLPTEDDMDAQAELDRPAGHAGHGHDSDSDSSSDDGLSGSESD